MRVLLLVLFCCGTRAGAQTREPARFSDVFPAATAGAAFGGVAGFQLGGDDKRVALAIGLIGGVAGSAAGAWLAERNDGTEIGFADALNAAATGVVPAILITGAVTRLVPKSMQAYFGTITFSILQGAGTAAMAARHSRHDVANPE